MSTLLNPQTVVLQTDVYTLDIQRPFGVGSPPYIGAVFSWMGMSNALWLPPHDPAFYIAWYYTRWQYSVTVNTVRTYSIGTNGLTITDSQQVTKVVMVASECPITYPTTANSGIGAWLYDAQDEMLALGLTSFPSSYSFSYTEAEYVAAGGTALPSGIPIVTDMLAGTVVNAQAPYVAVDPVNTFNTGSAVVHKLIGSNVKPWMNEGGFLDPQTTANAPLITYGEGSYNISSIDGVDYFCGVQETSFSLLLDRPNIPLGTLQCKSVPQGVFPTLPQLQITGNSNVYYTSALADVSSWGGFRYLGCMSRARGFSTTQPLPRIMLGIVPTSEVSAATCTAALAGTPTFGTWYELELTEQGTTGESLMVDLAMPIAGSGKWKQSDGSPYSLPDPLGVGIFTNNPCVPQPGGSAGALDQVTTPGTITLDTATIVLAVDGNTAALAGTAFITLSEFQLVEKSGSWISVNCNGVDAAPVVPAGQAPGVEASSPTDGTLITISRDGKPAVSLRWTNGIVVDPSLPTYQNPLPFLAYDYQPGLPTVVDWNTIIAGLNALGNGYEWTFTPLYTNFLTGEEYPPSFLPVPTKFEPTFFTLGAAIEIPIQARCVSYTNLVPWASVGVISGDDPVREDKEIVYVLCLSDYIGAFNFPVIVQSGRIGPGGVVAIANGASPYGPPALTSDYGPTVLTPDANGVITIPGGAPTSYGPESALFNASTFGEVLSGGPYTVTATQNEVTPQFDGFFISFDEGLAKGQSAPSGSLLWVYVPVRNGQAPPLGYGSSTIVGTAETLMGYDGPTYLARETSAAFCLRGPVGTVAKYSKPRHAIWHLSNDNRGRLCATLRTAFPPYAIQQVKYPARDGAFVTGFYPQLDINEAQMMAVYRRLDNKWVCTVTDDQWTTLGDETVLFNQSGGLVTFAYDESTGSQIYVMSLRDDGLSWLSTPAAAADPGRLPQVAVIRRRDAQGNSLPFVKTSAATISGTVWENVIFIDQPSGGTIGIQVLPQGTIVLVCGTTIYTSSDNGSNFYDQSSTLVNSLTNMASPPAGSTGGTQNP